MVRLRAPTGPRPASAHVPATWATWALLLLLVSLPVPTFGDASAAPPPSAPAQGLATLAHSTPGVPSVASTTPHTPQSTLSGVDVSVYQGSGVNWGSVHGAGNSFAFARAVAYYGHNDPDFSTNMVNGKAAGMYMGAYDFVYPASESATGDADYFNGVITPYVANGYMYPALDLESDCTASGGSLSASQITAWVNAWGLQLEKDLGSDGFAGVKPTVYMNGNYASNCIVSSSWDKWPLWIAGYWSPCATSPGPNTGSIGPYSYWQWCSSGSTGGISPVDQDIFAGSLSQLQSGFVFGGGAPTANYAMKDQTTNSALFCGGTFAAGDTIQFTASASGGTAPYTYAWDFGDGKTGSGNPVTHVYTAPGTIDAILTVTDAGGKTGTSGAGCPFTVTGTVRPALAALLAATPSSVFSGNTTALQVTVSSSSAPVAGAVVAFAASPTGGTFSSATATTNALGEAFTNYTSGSVSSVTTVSLNSYSTRTGYTPTNASTSLTVNPRPLTVQVAPVNLTTFGGQPHALSVNVSSWGAVLPGCALTFSDGGAGGSFSPATATSGSLGNASVTYTPPKTASGTNVTLMVSGTESGYTTVTGTSIWHVQPATLSLNLTPLQGAIDAGGYLGVRATVTFPSLSGGGARTPVEGALVVFSLAPSTGGHLNVGAGGTGPNGSFVVQVADTQPGGTFLTLDGTANYTGAFNSTASVRIPVVAAPLVPLATLSATATTMDAGQTLALVVRVTATQEGAAVSPDGVQVSFSSSAGGSFVPTVVTISGAGSTAYLHANYSAPASVPSGGLLVTLSVLAEATAGHTSVSNLSVMVFHPSGGGILSFAFQGYGLLLWVGVAAVAAVLVALILRRRRRRPHLPSTEPAAPSETPAEPSVEEVAPGPPAGATSAADPTADPTPLSAPSPGTPAPEPWPDIPE
ncbi:MAG: PKD domain-containing protein [Euryarchaeota archaeon]|nr:PKD domain-containing protein [Euryarchaeota archaeon]MDE1879546.1 PKD domain-containing protein [Euryarchaeota archaeon]